MKLKCMELESAARIVLAFAVTISASATGPAGRFQINEDDDDITDEIPREVRTINLCFADLT